MQHQDRRRITTQVPPAYEDGGLFHARPIQEDLIARPVYSRNGRGDLVIGGLVRTPGQSEREVELLFAGRRRPAATPLRQRLDALWTRARNAADRRGEALPAAGTIEQPIRALGTWRVRTEATDDGWSERRYQFVVAKWTLPSTDGAPHLFGEWPIGDWDAD